MSPVLGRLKMNASFQSESGSCLFWVSITFTLSVVFHASRYECSHFHCCCHLSDSRGISLPPLCGKCFSDESPCVSRTHTTVSEAFVEISFVTFANNVVSDKCRLHHFTTCSLPNKLVFYKGCQIPPVTQTDQEAAHEIFQPPPPHLFFLISLKILLHHLWMIKS